MAAEKFVLVASPTADCRVEIYRRDNEIRWITVRQEIHFDLAAGNELRDLQLVLEACRNDGTLPMHMENSKFEIDYDPTRGELEKLIITHRGNGREVRMALSTAKKLLSALEGHTDKLLRE